MPRILMNDLESLLVAAQADFAAAQKAAELEDAKARYLGKSGRVTELLKGMASLSLEPGGQFLIVRPGGYDLLELLRRNAREREQQAGQRAGPIVIVPVDAQEKRPAFIRATRADDITSQHFPRAARIGLGEIFRKRSHLL